VTSFVDTNAASKGGKAAAAAAAARSKRFESKVKHAAHLPSQINQSVSQPSL
jgi:hypothetical protein